MRLLKNRELIGALFAIAVGAFVSGLWMQVWRNRAVDLRPAPVHTETVQEMMGEIIRAEPVHEFRRYTVEIRFYGRIGPDGRPETKPDMVMRGSHE